MQKEILFCGQTVTFSCDENCKKAWGVTNRPVEKINSEYDEYLADQELDEAPEDPGTYEGGHAKPKKLTNAPNKWCARECERSSLFKANEEIVNSDWSERRKIYHVN